ncbi:MAG: ROK family protein [Deltaproteobacteria bacterium]
MPEFGIGIDLGGTKILAGLMTLDGEILKRRLIPTEAGSHVPGVIIDRMADSVMELMAEAGGARKVMGLACAAPGPITYPHGVIMDSPNLGWQQVRLRHELEKRLGQKVIVGKDTDLAALGEYYFGQGCQYDHLLYITVSTGIGGGIIADGMIYHGTRGGAGEFGHMVVNPNGYYCYCGRQGCLEAQASGTAIAKMAGNMMTGMENAWRDQANQVITAREVGMAAREGDKIALRILANVITDLSNGIANLVHIFNPQIVVLGGGVMQGLQDLILKPLRERVMEEVFPLHGAGLQIEVTSLGGDIGLYGCLAAILQERDK